jgi:hypothetical protein
MIAKHKALNEMMDEPKSNSKSADFWNWRESNQDDELRTSIFEKIERMFDAGKIGEQDAYELMATYDNEEFGAEEDLTDLDTPRRVFNKLKKHNALNEMMDEPESNSKQYTMIWSVKGFTRVRHIEAPDPIVAYKKFMADVQGLLNWRQTIDDLKWDDIKLDERDEFKSVRDSNIQGVVYYFDGFLSDDEIEDILDRINKGNPHYQSNKKNSTEDMPGFEGTKNDLDNLSISLNEGQLLLKKVYTQFK